VTLLNNPRSISEVRIRRWWGIHFAVGYHSEGRAGDYAASCYSVGLTNEAVGGSAAVGIPLPHTGVLPV
jgi:hypothetical protein